MRDSQDELVDLKDFDINDLTRCTYYKYGTEDHWRIWTHTVSGAVDLDGPININQLIDIMPKGDLIYKVGRPTAFVAGLKTTGITFIVNKLRLPQHLTEQIYE